VRRLDTMSDAGKSIAIWAGVTAVAVLQWAFGPDDRTLIFAAVGAQWPVIVGVGVALVAMGLALQYGLARLPANRAIVILLSELVVAAVASYLLAGERLRPQDGIGGALIVAASAASGWIEWRAARAAAGGR